METELLEKLLGFSNIKIESAEINKKGAFIIKLENTQTGCQCHKCGKKITKYYGHDRWITLRHLPILGKDTYIQIRPKRYVCEYCSDRPKTTQRPDWYERNRPHTKAYEEHILLMCINSTIEDVSRKERVGYEAVMGVINHHLGHEVKWSDYDQLSVLGLDEISLKKGHRDFVTIVTGRVAEKTVILGILKDRKKATVKEFLSSIPNRLWKTVEYVCSDMYEGFLNAAKESLPKKVKVVVDRFHVAKCYRGCVDTLRKKEMKKLKISLSEEAYGELKNVMWTLRKDELDLSVEEHETLNTLFKYSPDLHKAYLLRTMLTNIFEMDISRRAASNQLRKWIKEVRKSGLNCFDTFLVTLKNHLNEILNYFVGRYSSGFVEGLNNKIKVIKRRCYGILNIDHLFQRLYLDTSGYDLFCCKSNA